MRDTNSFNQLLTSLYRCRSYTIIGHTLENNLLDTELSQEQRELLQKLNNESDLDRIRLLIAIHLDMTDEADALKEWLSRKDARPTEVGGDAEVQHT